jgi:HPt (histidine-containing phosphotransfer) domain-containing protein
MQLHNQNSLFDLSYLNQIFQGNQEMIKQIIGLFLQQVPEYITEMEACVARNDLHALHPLAHKAKSSVSMLGLRSMEEKILLIEHRSREHLELEKLPELVDQVRSECNLANEALLKILH